MRRLSWPIVVSLAIHLAILLLAIGIGAFIHFGKNLPLSGSGGGGRVMIEIVGDGGSGGTEQKSMEAPAKTKTPTKKDATFKTEKKAPAHEEASSKKSGSPSVAMAGPGIGSGGPGAGAGPEGGTNAILAEIRARIERAKNYPLLLRQSGVQGVARVAFRINAQGQPENVSLKSTSGSPALDQEALATIKRAAPYPLYEDALEIGIHFEIKNP